MGVDTKSGIQSTQLTIAQISKTIFKIFTNENKIY